MSDYQHAQHVFYYPEGERIDYASPDEGVAAYMQTHYRGAGPVKQQDAIGSAGFAHAVSFKAATGVEHGIYLNRSGDKWVVAATSEVVPPERLTPNRQTVVVSEAEEELVQLPDDAEIAQIEADMQACAAKTFRITHYYDIGNQDVYVERREGSVDAKRAAVYCQFMCEEWFGQGAILTNLGIAALLVRFYGFRHTAVVGERSRTDIDMYRDREAACGGLYFEMMADASLRREGMREFMSPFIDGLESVETATPHQM